MVSRKDKVKAVLQKKLKDVSHKGNSMKAILEEDIDTAVRQILYVLWLSKGIPEQPQLQQADVSRWRESENERPNIGEVVIAIFNWGGGAVDIGKYVWRESWKTDFVQMWVPMPSFG